MGKYGKGGFSMTPINWDAMKQKYSKTIREKLSYRGEVNDIIDRLVRRRLKLGLTQSEVARRAGIKQSALARIENFAVTPRLDTLLMLSNVLGLEINIIEHSKDVSNQDSYYYRLALDRNITTPHDALLIKYNFSGGLPNIKPVFTYKYESGMCIFVNDNKRGNEYGISH